MYKFKIPIINKGPCGMHLKEWAITMILAQIIPFAIGSGLAFNIYFSSVDSEGRSISLVISIFCTIHLQFIILLLIGYFTKFLPILQLWMIVGIIEAFAMVIITFYTASIAFRKEMISYGILLTFCGPVFGCFLMYSVITMYSILHYLKENKNQRILIEGDQNIHGSDISIYA